MMTTHMALEITSQCLLRNGQMKTLFIDMKFPIFKTAPEQYAAHIM